MTGTLTLACVLYLWGAKDRKLPTVTYSTDEVDVSVGVTLYHSATLPCVPVDGTREMRQALSPWPVCCMSVGLCDRTYSHL